MAKAKTLDSYRNYLAKEFAALGKYTDQYVVPSLWIEQEKDHTENRLINISPKEYFLSSLDRIIKEPPVPIRAGKGGLWTRVASIYNMFVRTTCAVDHNQNGKLDLPVNGDGWRETGSFLKAMTMLPYVRSLGANTIHLLPITSIGSDGNKGSLGSPYAIKNAYELDENLSEPNLKLGAEEEFRLFVRAAHHLGMRVVVEFVFRTSSKDGDWVKEHPEWFYWIKREIEDREPGSHDETRYGNPIFTQEELSEIKTAVEQNDLENLPPPHEVYRQMFTVPPAKGKIRMEGGKYIGTLRDGAQVRIPGAFADWPPDDTQPPWGDVTYLKMYEHPEFNYIAYNTLRMYDKLLAQKKYVNKQLWETIEEIIPHYQHTFGIDGVMIDMGHALPMDLKQEMIKRARKLDPDFAFWDENFSVDTKSVEEGYNAVIGYQWSDQHHPEKFKSMLHRFSTEGFPLPYFATPESHNTPRAAARGGGLTYSRYAWAISNFLPAIPFIHSGFEIGETYPINTGLDFTKDQLKKLPSEKLPLFSEYAYDWASDSNLVPWVRKLSLLRRRYEQLLIDPSPESFRVLSAHPESVDAFLRKGRGDRHGLLIVANSNMQEEVAVQIHLDSSTDQIVDLLSGSQWFIRKNQLSGQLTPGQVAVFEL